MGRINKLNYKKKKKKKKKKKLTWLAISLF